VRWVPTESNDEPAGDAEPLVVLQSQLCRVSWSLRGEKTERSLCGVESPGGVGNVRLVLGRDNTKWNTITYTAYLHCLTYTAHLQCTYTALLQCLTYNAHLHCLTYNAHLHCLTYNAYLHCTYNAYLHHLQLKLCSYH